MENTQFGCNIWTNQKLPAEYVQPASGVAVDKQWKAACTSTASALRMPPGLELPASSQHQRPVSHLQMSRQLVSVPPAVPSNEAGWLKCVEPAEELAGAGRCHNFVPNGSPQNIGGQDNVISSDQYQQQQTLLLAQVQATLHALQNCPQQPVSTDQYSQHASVVGHMPATSQRPAGQCRFGISCRKPDELQAVGLMDAQQSIFVNGKHAHMLPATGNSDATTISATQSQLQHSSDILQQGQVPDLSKCIITPTPDRETGITMQPFPVPRQAVMQTVCGEPYNSQPGSSTSRRLLPACFQDSGRSFVRSSAVPLNCGIDRMQLEQNQLLVHGPNLRCNQSAWTGNNPRQSPYSQYCVPSNASAEQYSMVGRLTPVMVGPAGDLFCNSIPSQICTVPSPLMVGSKFPR